MPLGMAAHIPAAAEQTVGAVPAPAARTPKTRRLYRHLKRGTRYQVISEAAYHGSRAAREGDTLIMTTEPGNPGRIIARLALTAADAGDITFGHLQATGLIHPGRAMHAYWDIDSGHVWYRPTSEFQDGRFEEYEGVIG